MFEVYVLTWYKDNKPYGKVRLFGTAWKAMGAADKQVGEELNWATINETTYGSNMIGIGNYVRVVRTLVE